jgi:predicted metalloprotease with PDZ domain
MELARTLVTLLALASCALASPRTTLAPAAPPVEDAMIRYQVSLEERHAHRVTVRMSLEGLSGDALDLTMPVWTPGSYLVREYARHVIDLRASTADGQALTVEKTAKDAWRVSTDGASSVSVDYTLYANEVSVRTSHVDDRHAYLHPAATFLRHAPSAAVSHHVAVAAPDGWRVFTSLLEEGGGFVAEDYDVLIDSPFEVGPHTELTFEVEGVPHRIVLAGESDVDHDTMRDDVQTICQEVARIFGQLPFDRYLFIMALVDSGGGGLEHLNSSVCMYSRWKITDDSSWKRFLALVAHEYFHAWNVKRFRPEALGPFDYTTENYTHDLWVAEGITSYYDDLATLRAGFADKVGSYLSARAGAFKSESERPGADRMSLAASSFDSWIKLYRPDENSSNVSVSYYSKGALVALMLDLRIRRLTGGERTLADALRLGWERYAARGVGFPPRTIEALASEVADSDLSSFFEDYVRGTAPLAPDEDLAWVGLRLAIEPESTKRPLPQDDDEFPLEPWLGMTTRSSDGLARVDVVLEGGPAYRAGLNHDDLLLAVDDLRVGQDSLRNRLDRLADKDSVTVTFWRGQELRTLTVEPERRRLAKWSLESVDDLTDAQRDAFHTWTDWDHPAGPADADEEATED